MNKKSNQRKETIGLDIRETKQRLAELVAERKKVAEEIVPFMPNQYGDTPLKFIELSTKLNAIDNEIAEIREWYNLGLTERLHEESVLMNRLTIGLLVLTAIFGVLTAIDIISKLLH